MKQYRVTDASWANWRDLQLPFFAKWNRENPLPAHFWQRIWEYPFAALRIPAASHCIDVGGTYPFVLFRNFPNAISVDARDLNALDHPLHKGLWPSGKLSIQDAHHLDFREDEFEYSLCISALEEMPAPLDVVRELIRVTRRRIVITTDVSDHLGIGYQDLHALARDLRFDIPPIPIDSLVSSDKALTKWNITPSPEYRHIRTFGFVIDSVEQVADCAIVIPHWESYPFAEAAIRNIRKQANPRIRQHVYIVDDNSKDGSLEKLQTQFGGAEDLTVWSVQRPNATDANVGYLLDYAVRRLEEKYVCMTDADAFPISPHWLSFPIWLLERYHCSAVGCDTGLSNSYLPNNLYHWQNNQGYVPAFGIYDNENFTCINNFFRVMQTSLAQVVSEEVGFARRKPLAAADSHVISVFSRASRKIARILQKTFPIFRGRGGLAQVMEGSDNGVLANYFMDINRMGPKANLPLLSWVGFTPNEGVFGQNISGLLLHFALSTRALSRWRREVTDAGEQFARYARIIQTDGFTDGLLASLLEEQKLRAGGYHGEVPVSWYEAAQTAVAGEFQAYLKATYQDAENAPVGGLYHAEA